MADPSAHARDRIAGHDWWHAIEVAPGVVTPGWWDLRGTAVRMPWPSSLAGARCLDVGTMDGFWAFELERRGAGEVVAIDLGEGHSYDAPFTLRPSGSNAADLSRRRRFGIVAELLGSRVQYRELSVYELEPGTIGSFDVVVIGYVLQLLRDPLRALEAIRSVCRGHLLLLDTVSLPLSLIPVPVARLHARRDGDEWFVFNRRGLVQACRLAGFEVEAATGIIRDRPGLAVGVGGIELRGRAMHALGIRGRSVALRARAP